MYFTHDNNSTLLVKDDTLTLHTMRALLDYLSQLVVEGVRESHMTYKAALEKGERTDTLGPVDDLVGNDKIHWLDLLPERADGREGNDAAHTNVPKRGNAGTRRDFVRRKLVVMAMASEECYRYTIVAADEDGRRGKPPRCLGIDRGYRLKSLDLAETGTTNNGDVDGLCNGVSLDRFGSLVRTIIFTVK